MKNPVRVRSPSGDLGVSTRRVVPARDTATAPAQPAPAVSFEPWPPTSQPLGLRGLGGVGWSMNAAMTAQLVADALVMARRQARRAAASFRSRQPKYQSTVPATDGRSPRRLFDEPLRQPTARPAALWWIKSAKRPWRSLTAPIGNLYLNARVGLTSTTHKRLFRDQE
jgi:hypothetical protein